MHGGKLIQTDRLRDISGDVEMEINLSVIM